MSEHGSGPGAVLWFAGMLIGGYLDWRSKHAPKRAAERADERLARQGEGTLAAIENDREHRGEERRARAAALRDELARRSRSRRRRRPADQE